MARKVQRTRVMELTIKGRTYQVSRNPQRPDQWLLTGRRGAVYGTMRNHNRPHLMFVIDCRGCGPVAPLSGVCLTDESGELAVLQGRLVF